MKTPASITLLYRFLTIFSRYTLALLRSNINLRFSETITEKFSLSIRKNTRTIIYALITQNRKVGSLVKISVITIHITNNHRICNIVSLNYKLLFYWENDKKNKTLQHQGVLV